MDVHRRSSSSSTEFKRVANAIVDSYFIVDTERRIVDFNRAFFAMLPRQRRARPQGQALLRGPRAQHLQDRVHRPAVLDRQPARPPRRDLGQDRGRGPEAALHPVGGADHRRAGNHVGALEIQRNVTDEAVVQVKYQEMLETEARERERLANQVRARTKELLETNQLLLKTQKELLAYRA